MHLLFAAFLVFPDMLCSLSPSHFCLLHPFSKFFFLYLFISIRVVSLSSITLFPIGEDWYNCSNPSLNSSFPLSIPSATLGFWDRICHLPMLRLVLYYYGLTYMSAAYNVG